MEVRVRSYGAAGPRVVLLDGGPGAIGTVTPLARALDDRARFLVPLPRRSGEARLTVDRHLADLRDSIATLENGGEPVPIIGFSWGAMLALVHASRFPADTGPLLLIGCGTFDEAARERLRAALEARTTPALRARLEALRAETMDEDERMARHAALTLPLYAHDLTDEGWGLETVDARGHHETWSDMMELQARGVYPAAFAAIRSSVLMVHGAEDPHPGRMILDSLKHHVHRLDYREMPACGHYPWLERIARDGFLELVRGWLAGLPAGAREPLNHA